MISDIVARELHISYGWTREFVDKLAPYYLATLTHMSRGHPTPVYQIIDEVWHAHILCTRDYADFCARQFEQFIHHERSEPVAPDSESSDFFNNYGLSLAELALICAELNAPKNLALATCTSPDKGPPTVDTEQSTMQLPIASCGLPKEPPRAASEYTTIQFPIASCGLDKPASPNTCVKSGPTSVPYPLASCGRPGPFPTPPDWHATGEHTLALANCGQPDQPESPALNAR